MTDIDQTLLEKIIKIYQALQKLNVDTDNTLDLQAKYFHPVFWKFITQQQRDDYKQARDHFGPLYRYEDTNYFIQKLNEFKVGKWPKCLQDHYKQD